MKSEKINWKQIAQTPGYRSLKAAYIHDVKQGYRNKITLHKKFRWVIDRAKHYARHNNVSIETILDYWEEKRDYWWLNYYQETNQPKKHSNSKKPIGIKGLRNYLKKDPWVTPQRRKHRICEAIKSEQKRGVEYFFATFC